MRTMTVMEAQALCLDRNIPFYAYRLPGECEYYFGAQLNGAVRILDELNPEDHADGFIAVPFREGEGGSPLFVRADIAFQGVTNAQEVVGALQNMPGRLVSARLPIGSTSREEYRKQVTTMISALKSNVVHKMVLARRITVACDAYDNAPVWFDRLAVRYPDAFVFLVSVPGVMTWMGATPEIFLRQLPDNAQTMALAGSRPVDTISPWGEKEIEEQAIVSRYVSALLKDTCVEKWEQHGPFSKKAGNVEHLCTTFTYPGFLPAETIGHIRRSLHPTPAVGGFPTRKALELIGQIEGENRRYYAGYVGPVSMDGTFDWFVNLRSMEIFPQSVCLYVGGGITEMSDPEDEWEETVLKSHTLLDVII